MFIKLLKYDFMFSKNAFLGMAAVFLSLAVFIRIFGGNTFFHSVLEAGQILSGLLIAVVSILQIFHMYNKNMFGNSGYLLLTIPVKRGELLTSKLIISMMWYLFMLLIAFIALLIPRTGNHLLTINDFLDAFFWANFTVQTIELFMLGFFFISLLFFSVSLANSAFGKIRVHSVFSGFVAVVYAAAYFWIRDIMSLRASDQDVVSWQSGGQHFTRYIHTPHIGLQYGRIPMLDDPQFNWLFIDIGAHALTLVFAMGAVVATLYLLKNRIDLR